MKKIEAKQINEWAQRAYSNAVKHGWHNDPKPISHWLMMTCTEVAEAVEADRKGKYMDELDKDGLNTVLANDHGGGLFENYYKISIENKVESELADICIRMFDFIGVMKITIVLDIPIFAHEVSYLREHLFTEGAMYVNKKICNCDVADQKNVLGTKCSNVLAVVFEWAEALGIDLVQHINMKMRYNESREYHHGNKAY